MNANSSSSINKPLFSVAILDMYNGEPNQGMRCILDILNRFSGLVQYEIFDVRQEAKLPAIKSFDLYISTGGPGNPMAGDGTWDVAYYQFIDQLIQWNRQQPIKKYVLFICHSFQMACLHFGLAQVTKRQSTSFGVMSIHKVETGHTDPLFQGLNNPFWGIDSREYQVVQPDHAVFKNKGAQIISLEKIRTHVEYERAIMGVRFTPEMVGLQFHPEADPISFIANLRDADKRNRIIAMKGKKRFRDMLEDLCDDHKIYKTNETIIPNFIRQSINHLMEQRKMEVN
jgi:GMP synthase-like glutamine amidotransferase